MYVPEEWLRDEGLSSKALIADLRISQPLRRVIDCILRVADHIFVDAEVGVRMLPYTCQPAVQAAHLIYRSIGGILRNDLNGLRLDPCALQWPTETAVVSACTRADAASLARPSRLCWRPGSAGHQSSC